MLPTELGCSLHPEQGVWLVSKHRKNVPYCFQLVTYANGPGTYFRHKKFILLQVKTTSSRGISLQLGITGHTYTPLATLALFAHLNLVSKALYSTGHTCPAVLDSSHGASKDATPTRC